MRRSTTLFINEPCTEPWEQMTPQAGGRHCAACQKTVYDFTTFSDAELVAWFTQHSGPVCGRLHEDQLGVRLHADEPVSLNSRLRGWVRWTVALVLGWQSVRAQTVTTAPPARVVPPAISTVGGKQTLVIGTQKEPVIFELTGQVVDSTGKPLHKVLVAKEKVDSLVSTSNCVVLTDTAGRFAIPIYASDQRARKLALHFQSYTDNSRLRIVISAKEAAAPLRITMPKPQPVRCIVSGGLSAIRQPEPPKRRWSLFRWAFKS